MDHHSFYQGCLYGLTSVTVPAVQYCFLGYMVASSATATPSLPNPVQGRLWVRLVSGLHEW